MPREIAMLDALVPIIFLVFLMSVVLQSLQDRVLAWCGVYRHVWHPPLFRLSCFVCIFGASGLLVLR
jgi:protein-S-isoprenylcysteine O-methyltransferase Ste14